MHPIRVSSNWTLFLKIFFPTFWIVFFGSLLFFIVVLNGLGAMSAHPLVKIAAVLIFAMFFAALYFSVMKLKRVEMGEDHFFVTNYFRTYRYSYDSIAAINETDLFVTHLVSIRFTAKSAFGKKVFFISRTDVWREFIAGHPALFGHLLDTPHRE